MKFWEYAVSFLSGIIASIIAWVLVFRIIVPKIQFSEKISMKADGASSFKYRVKFFNIGSRSIYDIDIYAKLSIRGLHKERKRNLEVTYLHVSFEGKIPVIESHKESHRGHLISIEPNKEKEFERDIYPIEIQTKAKENQLKLEDLLNIGSEAWVELFFIGSDQYSGARKVMVSKKFYIHDITEKSFKKNSLEIEE